MTPAAGAGEAPIYAAFISPHGFGHAARASAVLQALHRRVGARFLLFSTVPRWFFDETLEGLYEYHPVKTDVGLVQRSALTHDLDATVRALDEVPAFDGPEVRALAEVVERAGVQAVLADIAPLGIAVAESAGVPSVLLENFTWPWLYEPYHERAPGLEAHSRRLTEWFARAHVHLQTEPLCRLELDADALLPPISRPPRRTRAAVREELGIPEDAPLVVLTMGGVDQPLPFVDRLRTVPEAHFLVTGMPETRRLERLHLFDNDTRIHLPDFVEAADGVVAKLGYSTAAEVWAAGVPMAWVTREDFRETGPLRRWAEAELDGFGIPGAEFGAGGWIRRIPELLEREGRARREGAEGLTPAEMAAEHLAALVR